jgi:uncharacterized FAD-dependent dehydrogenase
MIKLSNIKMGLDYTRAQLLDNVAKTLGVRVRDIEDLVVLKKSVDARKKPSVIFILTVGVVVRGEPKGKFENFDYKPKYLQDIIPLSGGYCSSRPIIVGSGPAGLFCGLTLAKKGLRPIIIERGDSVENRCAEVEKFYSTGVLNKNSNIQFGEGGAGTFSDGKLNTGVSSEFTQVVINEFEKHGAPQEIVFSAKPHIGTDKLVEVVKNIRKEIEALGGEVRFNTTFKEFISAGGKVSGVKLQNKDGEYSLEADTLILAVGHSSRDTFEMLNRNGVEIQQKPFAIGVRIEHLQSKINFSQYGFQSNPHLGAADYKLSCHLDNGRSVFTFCMCPGGYVMPAASEDFGIVTNGMSKFARDGKNANSGLLVNVTPEDFGGSDALAGVAFQRKYEQAAYLLSGSHKAPVQLVGDFLNNKTSKAIAEVEPTYAGGYIFASLDDCLPNYVTASLRQGIKVLDNKLRGFGASEAVMTGVETRTSSPIKIVRDETMQSNIRGIYPCGEGAGYAGGITSSAIDGIKVALAVIMK